ncbi:MAG: Fic/DOC family N-terminal domain-containing protein [Edaphocola sp.]
MTRRTGFGNKAGPGAASAAHRHLALLDGRCATIPNENILINTLSLQEAKESSAIENIITTHDEIYKAGLLESFVNDAAAEEVMRYAQALRQGFREIRQNKLIANKHILQMQQMLEQNDAGYRRNSGTRTQQTQMKSHWRPPEKPGSKC